MAKLLRITRYEHEEFFIVLPKYKKHTTAVGYVDQRNIYDTEGLIKSLISSIFLINLFI